MKYDMVCLMIYTDWIADDMADGGLLRNATRRRPKRWRIGGGGDVNRGKFINI